MNMESCSVDSSAIPTMSKKRCRLTMKATELRLGLPGSESPDQDVADYSLIRYSKPDEKSLFPLQPLWDIGMSSLQNNFVSSKKLGLSDAMDAYVKGNLYANLEAEVSLFPHPSCKHGIQSSSLGENPVARVPLMKERVLSSGVSNEIKVRNRSAPAAKVQVVGWPPVRSLRKNSLQASSKNAYETDRKARSAATFVKVSMDGAPYQRKIDLESYTTYGELSLAIEKLFSCFTIGQSVPRRATSKDRLNVCISAGMVHGWERVLIYEDKDGDWMLVGDVPWEMFTDTCKRLRIMKGSDTIGLAPWVEEKYQSTN